MGFFLSIYWDDVEDVRSKLDFCGLLSLPGVSVLRHCYEIPREKTLGLVGLVGLAGLAGLVAGWWGWWVWRRAGEPILH